MSLINKTENKINQTASVVKVSSVTMVGGGTVSLICLYSLITWWLENVFIVAPFFAILGLFAGAMFMLMGYKLKQEEN